jgi:SAM-dependent methyltransferase
MIIAERRRDIVFQPIKQLKMALPPAAQSLLRSIRWVTYRTGRRFLGERDELRLRVVMHRETEKLVRALPYDEMDALEISGTRWQGLGFASFCHIDYPDYDVCEAPLVREAFDFIYAEEVWEHLLWPYRATRNVHEMLRPGGYFMVSTPFLVRIYEMPADCSRWTETGLKHLLAECGFQLDDIVTGSWGNRKCIKSNRRFRRGWVPWLHSLRNESAFPVSVWALARKTYPVVLRS